jgi:hypothetical protein
MPKRHKVTIDLILMILSDFGDRAFSSRSTQIKEIYVAFTKKKTAA